MLYSFGQKLRICVLGTGLMGAPMARNLLKAGFETHVWNRSIEKAAALVSEGATVHKTPAEAADQADIVITMLSNGQAVEEIYLQNGVAKALKKGTIAIDMSSTKPREAKALAAKLKELGILWLDAPVSGGVSGAEAATLAIMVGGEDEIFAKAEIVLKAMGRPVRVGPIGAGQLTKLANQAIVAITIGAVSEAVFLAERGGVNIDAMRDALRGGFADSTILQEHAKRMSDRNFAAKGPVRHQLKDLNNVVEEAEILSVKMPMLENIRDRFSYLANDMGHADSDHAALFLELLEQNEKITIKGR